MNSIIGWKTNIHDDFWKNWNNPNSVRKEVVYDLSIDENILCLKYALPGVEKEDLELETENNKLFVRLIKDTTFVSAFDEVIKLEEYNQDTIKTSLVNGVLEITMEKKAELKPKKLKI